MAGTETPQTPEAPEIEEKSARLAHRLGELGLDGALLATQANFAWITGGAANGIDITAETGVGAALVGRDGRRWLLANEIEMPRFLAEDRLAERGFAPVDFPWAAEQGDGDLRLRAARDLLGPGARLGADWSAGGLPHLGRDLYQARARLTAPEVDRYRRLGRDAGEALGEVCRGLRPGISEDEVAARAAAALTARGAQPVVLLVAADERLESFRHPLPTAHRWRRGVMVVACARRAGLIVALTRIVWAGAVPDEVRRRTRAAAEVNAELLAHTRPGATGRELFAAAARVYAEQGFPGEERRHHQGGPLGYQSRDWIAHPASEETVASPQAFAWNPSVTGTKVEETWLVQDGQAECLTATPGWPALEVRRPGQIFTCPDVASLDSL
ncbi:MAG TPA: M24 family metallopeptidase [Thermoanaerobaculia bacterium]|nr:M24 family metallopeptidase [Thermoanaerobaculia bacterium]